jgi:hypothetical protein
MAKNYINTSGVDVARALACGACSTFIGIPFMYGLGALGTKGGDHTIAIMKTQLHQFMEQLIFSISVRSNDFFTFRPDGIWYFLLPNGYDLSPLANPASMASL